MDKDTYGPSKDDTGANSTYTIFNLNSLSNVTTS